MLLVILRCHTPTVNRGLNVNSSPFLLIWRWNIPPKSGVGMSDWGILEQMFVWWRRLVALWKPSTSSIRRCVQYSTGTSPRPLKWPAKGGYFVLTFCWLLPWRPPGQYIVSSCLIAMSSGFRNSPGHATSGDALCIAQAHRHVDRNGRRTRCFVSHLWFRHWQ